MWKDVGPVHELCILRPLCPGQDSTRCQVDIVLRLPSSYCGDFLTGTQDHKQEAEGNTNDSHTVPSLSGQEDRVDLEALFREKICHG